MKDLLDPSSSPSSTPSYYLLHSPCFWLGLLPRSSVQHLKSISRYPPQIELDSSGPSAQVSLSRGSHPNRTPSMYLYHFIIQNLNKFIPSSIHLLILLQARKVRSSTKFGSTHTPWDLASGFHLSFNSPRPYLPRLGSFLHTLDFFYRLVHLTHLSPIFGPNSSTRSIHMFNQAWLVLGGPSPANLSLVRDYRSFPEVILAVYLGPHQWSRSLAFSHLFFRTTRSSRSSTILAHLSFSYLSL